MLKTNSFSSACLALTIFLTACSANNQYQAQSVKDTKKITKDDIKRKINAPGQSGWMGVSYFSEQMLRNHLADLEVLSGLQNLSPDSQDFIDPSTGLTWSKCPVGTRLTVMDKRGWSHGEMTMGTGLYARGGIRTHCEGDVLRLTFAEAVQWVHKNQPGWRLPTSDEYRMLIGKIVDDRPTVDRFWSGRVNNSTPKGYYKIVSFIFPHLSSVSDSTWSLDKLSVNYGLADNIRYRSWIQDIYTHGKRPIIIVKDTGVNSDWVSIVKETVGVDAYNQASIRQQAADLAPVNALIGKVVENLKAPAANSTSSAPGGGSPSSEAGGRYSVHKDNGRAASWQWFKQEVIVKCEGGRKNGDLLSVYLEGSGRWSTTYVPGKFDSLSAAATAACQ